MSTPLPIRTAPPTAPSIVTNLSPIVLHYLEAISSGKRPLSSSQASELAQNPHDNKFLKYMSSASSSASSPIPPVDLSYPISNYFINSSHNTYLTGNQLYSESSTGAYSNVGSFPCPLFYCSFTEGQPSDMLHRLPLYQYLTRFTRLSCVVAVASRLMYGMVNLDLLPKTQRASPATRRNKD